MKKLSGVILLLMLLFTACGVEKEKEKEKEIEKLEYKGATNNYKYNLVIPQILNVQSEDISYFNLSLQENARLIIDELLESTGEIKPSAPYEAEMSYEVKENDFGITSIVVKRYTYTGGAHGNTTLETYNLLDKDLKLINFESFFNDNAQSYFEMKINDAIENKERVKNINGEEVIFFENPEVNIKNTVIYFEGDSVKFVFPLYDLAPYSSGMPVFKFSKDEIKKYIR
ncbi:DUF3298 and DUF4163 domain-containing protein [uncultured Fusobacterium sp.]|jgi:hypothetical protein|uniref:DUF3298 and DUF4163 domain-containing protein n=1 Tax=uncultured Fusobacterium sp. TaxID=159267 RepID=UPI0015A6B87C|nr:DUF3298 and DUF4163 domain-containing protein [uncultured Fusobacterium sp.]